MVKNRLMTLVVVGLALGLSATSVMAQGQGGRGGRGGFIGGGFGQNVFTIAANDAVAKDLGLSDDVTAKVKKVRDDYMAELAKSRPERPAQGTTLSDAERAERTKKAQDTAKAARETFTPKLKEALNADQFKRVQEIAYQAAGPGAFNDPEVVAALGITKEQTDKITAANRAAGEKQRELFTAGGGNGGGNREKMQEINKARDTEVAAVLTADQTAKWNTMKGKEFDVAKLRPMGGAGGGRGGRGGNGGGRGGNGGRPATE